MFTSEILEKCIVWPVGVSMRQYSTGESNCLEWISIISSFLGLYCVLKARLLSSQVSGNHIYFQIKWLCYILWWSIIIKRNKHIDPLPAGHPKTSKRSDMCPCHSCGRILKNLADVMGGLMSFVTILLWLLLALKIYINE